MIKTYFIILLLTCVLHNSTAEDIGCFVDGECTQSPYVEEWSAADAQECLELCRDFDGCQYFTYYGLDEDCVCFAACVELNPTSCEECYSGNSTCPDLQCWLRGSCSGDIVSQNYVDRDTTCLESCQNEDGCNWLTHNDANGACILFEDCPDVSVDGCDTCWPSQMQCGERRDYTKILIVGGYNDETGEYLDTVEVIDFSSDSQNCAKPANYPFPVYYMTGTILNDMPTICGGFYIPRVTDECFQYDYNNNRWIPSQEPMIDGRWGHKGSMVDSKTWLISGGEDGYLYEHSYDTTEVYYGNGFEFGPALPQARKYHCQVTLNSSHIAILGGNNGTETYLHDFYLLDWDNQEYIVMPDVPVVISADPCGLIDNSANGQELVVLAGHNNCQIFNLRDQTWRSGPTLADDIVGESMVAQMTKSFYIMGGKLENNLEPAATDAVYEFDAENYEWVKQTFILSTPRRGGVAIPVPDYMVDCS